MNKYVIPAILGIVVLMAGMFAFMPVQKATTVHSGLSGEIDDLGVVICVDVLGGIYNPADNSCTGVP